MSPEQAVLTSIDLINWTDEGVTLSDPDDLHHRLASIARPGPSHFLRLAVEVP